MPSEITDPVDESEGFSFSQHHYKQALLLQWYELGKAKFVCRI
jgi:hypothetical protein